MQACDHQIIDADGTVHPGFDASPVPITAHDVKLAAGFATTAAPAERAAGEWS